MGSKWVHRISEIVPEMKMGFCHECGWVDLYLYPKRNVWACNNARKADMRRYNERVKMGGVNAPSMEERLVCLGVIDDFWKKNFYSPTLMNLLVHGKFRSLSQVAAMVVRLRVDGYLLESKQIVPVWIKDMIVKEMG